MKIVVGSRGSNLALTQSKWVINEIKKQYPELDFELKIISTKGDENLNIALDKFGDTGIFVKEIEQALLRGDIDMAIHSMKDMPTEMTPGLIFTMPPRREDARDVMIFREDIKSIDDLPPGSIIGTSSKTRQYQILQYRPDFKTAPIRGSVETRIRKLEEGQFDAIILAAAGINRIHLEEKIGCYLPTDRMVPSPAQGTLALQIREGHQELKTILESIGDQKADIQTKAERTFLKTVNQGYSVPVGAYCDIQGQDITLTGILGCEHGSQLVKRFVQGKIGQEKELGETLAVEMLEVLDHDRG